MDSAVRSPPRRLGLEGGAAALGRCVRDEVSLGGEKKEKKNESVRWHCAYYVIWWEGKTVQKIVGRKFCETITTNSNLIVKIRLW